MKHRRRGASLIEVMVVISITGIMISAAGVCLHGLYRIDQQVRETAVQRWAFHRLSLQLRMDAHAARQARLQDGGPGSQPTLRLDGPGQQSVEYRAEPEAIVRTVRQADQVLHTETYAIGRRTTVAWRVDSEEVQAVCLELTQQAPEAREPSAVTHQRVQAVIGLHEQLSSKKW
jgi:prepilin-type N-terminal cleavage/methylation domain-containing protein